MTMCRPHVSSLALLALASALACSACSKTDTAPNGAPSAVAVPTEAPTIAITGTPPPAPASASAKTATTAPPITASAAATTAPQAPALVPASARISGKNFTLDAASPGCHVDTPCTMTLRLAAAGDYHVNKEYPYKFVASAAPAVQFLGSADAPSTFSRAAGDFHEDGEKAATMTIRFKPTAAGQAQISGTYKMSVCSAENCQVESPTVTLAVPVK